MICGLSGDKSSHRQSPANSTQGLIITQFGGEARGLLLGRAVEVERAKSEQREQRDIYSTCLQNGSFR